jgi:hypothetical protein
MSRLRLGTNKASALTRLLWTQLYPVNPPSLGDLDEDEEVLIPAEGSASASAFLSPSSSCEQSVRQLELC